MDARTIDQVNAWDEPDLATAKRIEVRELRVVHLAVDGVPVWAKLGDVMVTATVAGTDCWMVPANNVDKFTTKKGQTHLSIIEARPSASASVTVRG